jgi:hypothetical protein
VLNVERHQSSAAKLRRLYVLREAEDMKELGILLVGIVFAAVSALFAGILSESVRSLRDKETRTRVRERSVKDNIRAAMS